LDHLLYYGDGDIVSLKAVYYKLRPYIAPNFQYAVKNGDSKFHCPECSALPYWNKTYTTAQGTIQHYMKCRNKECRTTFKINNKTYQDWFKYKVLKGIKN